MRTRGSLLVLALVLQIAGFAQLNGIRFILPEFVSVNKGASMFGHYLMGMGYDRAFNGNLSMGVDITANLLSADDDDEGYGGTAYDVSVPGYDAAYFVGTRILSIQYHTAFAFGDNETTHFYLGSFIGYRRVKQTASLTYTYDPFSSGGGLPPIASYAQGSGAVFPIGLRAGVRGGLDGGYCDLYLQFGRVLGGGESVFSQTYLSGDGFDLASTAFTVGFAYGIGW
jgi:hypothetical protein